MTLTEIYQLHLKSQTGVRVQQARGNEVTFPRVSAVCLTVLFSFSVLAKDGPSGFSGKWELDTSQSTATSDIPDGLQQQIKQKGSQLVIQSKWKEPQNGVAPLVLLGVMTTELKMKTDGTQDNTQIGPFMATSSTSQDGDAMVTKWQTNANGEAVTSQWRRSLSPDGKTMTLEIQETNASGKNGNAKLVFKRK
jgi:hypothetical protein